MYVEGSVNHLNFQIFENSSKFVIQPSLFRVATVREKYLENEIFSRSGKSWNLVDGQGNLERIWKVREFENKLRWQA